jgi:hypothetical protein
MLLASNMLTLNLRKLWQIQINFARILFATHALQLLLSLITVFISYQCISGLNSKLLF